MAKLSDERRGPSVLPSLAGAPWLAARQPQDVLAALAAAGHDARVVGGSVRNALLGLPVTDIDIATPAPPHDVVEACQSAGLLTVPTGLEHGTVTVVVDHQPVEVTTLRRDVETDGRRAVVAFTDDWREDASRRDFTMNAIYCDRDGRLYDPVGGYPDLMARRVRFIGDADARVREDYLRILRFFRFHATYGLGRPDAPALAASARGLSGLARLSAERVRGEVVKLLVAPGLLGAVAAMGDIGLLPRLLGLAPRPGVLGAAVAAEASMGGKPDAMLRLAALALAGPDDIDPLARRLRLSGAEKKALFVLDLELTRELGDLDEAAARRYVYRHGAASATRRGLAALALLPHARDASHLLLGTAREWTPPRLPVGGADVYALGIAAGPEMGRLLGEIEAWWVANDFPGADATLAHLRRLVGAPSPGAGRPPLGEGPP